MSPQGMTFWRIIDAAERGGPSPDHNQMANRLALFCFNLLKQEMPMDPQIRGNPGVVGLAGFGITTLLLQFHNLGWCGSGVVFCTALMFGGGAQLIAGFQEFKAGNNFGYSAFTAYGAFWLALAFIFLILDLQGLPNSVIAGPLKIGATDIGYFMLAYTVYTAIMLIGSLAVHLTMTLTFLTLLLGFMGLDLVFLLGMKSVLRITAIDLIVCALLALYMMAHAIFAQVFGRDVLPVGKPLVSKATTQSLPKSRTAAAS